MSRLPDQSGRAGADLPREFASREQLIAFVRGAFPGAGADGASETRGGRAEGLSRVRAMEPREYARTRNSLDGAVTGLSAHLRHGCVTLAEARDAALAMVDRDEDAHKLVQELAWRDYYQRVYGAIGDGVWRDIEAWKTGRDAGSYSRSMPEDVEGGSTGLACMDAFVRGLVETGSMHNHARMWFASYLVHWRGVHWSAGASFFLAHLLDADVASNNLSWQWVASTFGQKPYIFNRENLERFTGGAYCDACARSGDCPFDASYEALDRRLFGVTVEGRERRG